MVSPENRALEDTAAKNYGYGGIGNDTVYGTDAADLLAGDEYSKTDMLINEMDLRGGNDVIRGYGGRDIIKGGFGDDLLDGGDDVDLLYG